MPIIQAYQCPKTLKLFAEKDRYRAHLKGQAKLRLNERRVSRMIATLGESFAEMRKAASIDAIVEWIDDHQGLFWLNACMVDAHSMAPKYLQHIDPTEFRIFDVAFDVKWDEHISNSHRAPFGQPTNWGRDPRLPTGFPGFKGRLTFSIVEPPFNKHMPRAGFFGKGLRSTGINTGSGSGSDKPDGSIRYGYEVTLFADDWPSLAVAEKLRQA